MQTYREITVFFSQGMDSFFFVVQNNSYTTDGIKAGNHRGV